MLRLYELAPTRSLRALWALQELELPFETVTVDPQKQEHRRPDYLAINPAGKLPALVDGDAVITESAAIVMYLCEKHGLWPATVEERAQLYRWVCFTITELEHIIGPDGPNSPDEQQEKRQKFLAMAAVVEKHLQDRPYLLGDSVSAADFVLVYTLDLAHGLKLLTGLPNCRAYLERMYSRPKAPFSIAAAFRSLGITWPE